jgi:hypothetical protein
LGFGEYGPQLIVLLTCIVEGVPDFPFIIETSVGGKGFYFRQRLSALPSKQGAVE